MTAKIISISDKAKARIKQVDQAQNEEELKTKWLVPILQSHFHPRQDGLHYEKQVLKGRVDVRLMHEGRTRGAIELKSPTISLDRDSQSFNTFFMQAHKYAHAFYVWRKGLALCSGTASFLRWRTDKQKLFYFSARNSGHCFSSKQVV